MRSRPVPALDESLLVELAVTTAVGPLPLASGDAEDTPSAVDGRARSFACWSCTSHSFFVFLISCRERECAWPQLRYRALDRRRTLRMSSSETSFWRMSSVSSTSIAADSSSSLFDGERGVRSGRCCALLVCQCALDKRTSLDAKRARATPFASDSALPLRRDAAASLSIEAVGLTAIACFRRAFSRLSAAFSCCRASDQCARVASSLTNEFINDAPRGLSHASSP